MTNYPFDAEAARAFLEARYPDLEPGEREKGYSLTTVFGCPRGSTSIRAVSGMPEAYRELVRDGFDLNGYVAESQRVAS